MPDLEASPIEPSIGKQWLEVKASLELVRERARKQSERLLPDTKQQRMQAISHIAKKRECVESMAVERSAAKKRRQESRMPHENAELQAKKMPCKIVVPSYPYGDRIHILRTHTLAFLERQGVPARSVFVVVADANESKKYRSVLGENGPRILIAQRGVVEARNWIVHHFPANTHVLSLDDDVQDVLCKTDHNDEPYQLPPGGLCALVHDAQEMMRRRGAFIWGLNSSSNPRNLRQVVSQSNGLINGHFYGFINRPDCPELLPSLGVAAEDCERSVRFFAKDHVVLRYAMYVANTTPYANLGGLQSFFVNHVERKEAENAHIARLQEKFPGYVRHVPKDSMITVNIRFVPMGMPPLRLTGNDS